jgi:hypothetical protein
MATPSSPADTRKQAGSRKEAAERGQRLLCVEMVGPEQGDAADHRTVEEIMRLGLELTALPAGVEVRVDCPDSRPATVPTLLFLYGEGEAPVVAISAMSGRERVWAEPKWWVLGGKTGERLAWAGSVIGVCEEALGELFGQKVGGAARRAAEARVFEGSRYSRRQLRRAWMGGLGWMIKGALTGDAGKLSDYMQVFLIVWRSAAHAPLRRLGRRVGTDLAARYKRIVKLPTLKSAVEVIYDAAAGLVLLNDLGERHPKLRKALAEVIGALPKRKLLRQAGQAWHAEAEGVLDALVDLYFLERLDLPLPTDYVDVVLKAVSWPLRPLMELGGVQYDVQTYLVTHTIYVLSEFDILELDPKQLPRQTNYLISNVDYYLDLKDVETVGEIGDCLKILGFGYESEPIRRIVSALIGWQNEDGSWGKIEDADDYVRYHSTWTAFNGILEYEFSAKGPKRESFRRILRGEGKGASRGFPASGSR